MNWIGKILIFVAIIASTSATHAQISGSTLSEKKEIRQDEKRKLYLDLDVLTFFKNNEYVSDVIKGYTLPGFWLRPKLEYNMLDNVKLELGAHMLHYWGATSYPCFALSSMLYSSFGRNQNPGNV